MMPLVSPSDPLLRFGWTGDLARSVEIAEVALRAARVAASHGVAVALWTRQGERNGVLGPALGEPPAVGDWVLAHASDPAGDWTIHRLLPRRTQLVRHASGGVGHPQVIAANVDRVIVATSLDGDFNPRRLERYLLAVAGCGVEATLLLTKADACVDIESYRRQAENLAETRTRKRSPSRGDVR